MTDTPNSQRLRAIAEQHGTVTRSQLAALRRAQARTDLLDAGLSVAADKGYAFMRKADVAAAADRATGSINATFGTMDAFRAAVMAEAVARGVLVVVAQGLANGDTVAMSAPDDLKRQAAEGIAA